MLRPLRRDCRLLSQDTVSPAQSFVLSAAGRRKERPEVNTWSRLFESLTRSFPWCNFPSSIARKLSDDLLIAAHAHCQTELGRSVCRPGYFPYPSSYGNKDCVPIQEPQSSSLVLKHEPPLCQNRPSFLSPASLRQLTFFHSHTPKRALVLLDGQHSNNARQ